MKFKIKKTREKDAGICKTLYIKQSLVEKINKIAQEYDTSWNNVVISMIKSCLDEE